MFAVLVLDDMESAIKVATGKLGLQPGAAFQARVAQLAEIVKAHKLVRLILIRTFIVFVNRNFRSEYECEIENEYDFQISNQSHPQNSRSFPLFISR